MKSEQWLLTDSPLSQNDWPNDGCIVLVLDGNSVPDIARSIYEWSGGNVETECLYAATRWESVSELAPWLVWLEDAEDPVFRKFIEEGAKREWGYLLLSDQKPGIVREYLRQLIELERVAGCPELLRIAHPELARSIIGERLIAPSEKLPSAVIRQVVSPDLVNAVWVSQEPSPEPKQPAERNPPQNLEALEASFSDFNRRKDNLAIWELLGWEIREWLGGHSLPEAYPRLAELTRKAEFLAYLNPREKMRYVLEQYRRDQLASDPGSNAHTFMDEQ